MKYTLFTKHEIKMAGYWPSSVFAFLCTRIKSRSKRTHKSKKKKGRGDENQKVRKSQKDESLLIDDSEEEDDFIWTPNDDIWETAEFEKYVMLHPQKAPTLSRINLEFKTNTCASKYCNPLYECVFIHPISQKEMIVDVASTVLFNVPDYKIILKSYREGNT